MMLVAWARLRVKVMDGGKGEEGKPVNDAGGARVDLLRCYSTPSSPSVLLCPCLRFDRPSSTSMRFNA